MTVKDDLALLSARQTEITRTRWCMSCAAHRSTVGGEEVVTSGGRGRLRRMFRCAACIAAIAANAKEIVVVVKVIELRRCPGRVDGGWQIERNCVDCHALERRTGKWIAPSATPECKNREPKPQ